MRVSNIYLHGAMGHADRAHLLIDLIEFTGLVPSQSNREKNKILMVTPEAAMIRQSLQAKGGANGKP